MTAPQDIDLDQLRETLTGLTPTVAPTDPTHPRRALHAFPSLHSPGHRRHPSRQVAPLSRPPASNCAPTVTGCCDEASPPPAPAQTRPARRACKRRDDAPEFVPDIYVSNRPGSSPEYRGVSVSAWR